MFYLYKAALLPLIAIVGVPYAVVPLAAAQTSPGHAMQHQRHEARPDAADPKAPVPPVIHRSALTDYRPLGDAGVGPWRDANDEVGRIGGWRAYSREAQSARESARGAHAPQSAPGMPSSQPGTPAAPSSPSPHKH